MTRIPRLGRDQIGEAQRAVYDAITGGPRAAGRAFRLTGDDGSLEGPFNAMLLHPPLGNALQELGAPTTPSPYPGAAPAGRAVQQSPWQGPCGPALSDAGQPR
jgi:hypothetical protein